VLRITSPTAGQSVNLGLSELEQANEPGRHHGSFASRALAPIDNSLADWRSCERSVG
jgi:hypothetical protein